MDAKTTKEATRSRQPRAASRRARVESPEPLRRQSRDWPLDAGTWTSMDRGAVPPGSVVAPSRSRYPRGEVVVPWLAATPHASGTHTRRDLNTSGPLHNNNKKAAHHKLSRRSSLLHTSVPPPPPTPFTQRTHQGGANEAAIPIRDPLHENCRTLATRPLDASATRARLCRKVLFFRPANSKGGEGQRFANRRKESG